MSKDILSLLKNNWGWLTGLGVFVLSTLGMIAEVSLLSLYGIHALDYFQPSDLLLSSLKLFDVAFLGLGETVKLMGDYGFLLFSLNTGVARDSKGNNPQYFQTGK